MKAADARIIVARETKGRKGKGVTVISGLPLTAAELRVLATQLKKRCGSGGTVDGDRIEIQGDHRDVIVKELAQQGWQARRAGG
jgi:translation initiation factor 1